jgi:hypothetical protein
MACARPPPPRWGRGRGWGFRCGCWRESGAAVGEDGGGGARAARWEGGERCGRCGVGGDVDGVGLGFVSLGVGCRVWGVRVRV